MTNVRKRKPWLDPEKDAERIENIKNSLRLLWINIKKFAKKEKTSFKFFIDSKEVFIDGSRCLVNRWFRLRI